MGVNHKRRRMWRQDPLPPCSLRSKATSPFQGEVELRSNAIAVAGEVKELSLAAPSCSAVSDFQAAVPDRPEIESKCTQVEPQKLALTRDFPPVPSGGEPRAW